MLEDQFLSFISDHISLKSGKKKVCLVMRYMKPTLGGKGPGYRLSAAVEDGGWLHTASHLQSPWFVCSGRSPQPPGHLHKKRHGHSQLSLPEGQLRAETPPSPGCMCGSTAAHPGLPAQGCSPGCRERGGCSPLGSEVFAVHIQALERPTVSEECRTNVYQRGMFLGTAYLTE